MNIYFQAKILETITIHCRGAKVYGGGGGGGLKVQLCIFIIIYMIYWMKQVSSFFKYSLSIFSCPGALNLDPGPSKFHDMNTRRYIKITRNTKGILVFYAEAKM